MLDGLDEINWSSLTHAYGKADDVPELLKTLLSSNKEERDDALYDLFGNIWHQGTVYDATPHAIPFLIELLQNEITPDREGVTHLLTVIAAGSGFLEVHAQTPDEMVKWSKTLTNDGRDFEKEREEERRIVTAVREACRPHLALFLPYLEDPNSRIRDVIAQAFSKYPEERDWLLPALEGVSASETDEELLEVFQECIAGLK